MADESTRHPISPCSNCPYRVDAPRGYWSPAEFVDLLAADRSPLGKTYACHQHATRAQADRGLCAGWLLDQKKRGLPSIALRLLLITDPTAEAALERVTAGGHRVFATIKQMCRANGVPRSR